MQSSKVRVIAWLIGGSAATTLSVFAIMIFEWGDGQVLQPRNLERRLRVGQSFEEAVSAIGLPADNRRLQRIGTGDKAFACSLSNPGIGAFFIPQHEVVLRFDEQRRLTSASFEWCYRTDESWEPLAIG